MWNGIIAITKMSRLVKGLTYGFSRNLGKKDRIIRAVISVTGLTSCYFGAISWTVGIVLGVLAIMILGTSATARFNIDYIANISTVSKKEQEELKAKGINFEK